MNDDYRGPERRQSNEMLLGELLATQKILVTRIDGMEKHIQSINDRLATGKGVVVGLMLAAGTTGAAAMHFAQKLFGSSS